MEFQKILKTNAFITIDTNSNFYTNTKKMHYEHVATLAMKLGFRMVLCRRLDFQKDRL